MTIETKKARFTKEELATEFEIGNLEERFNNAKKLVRYRLNSKGTKCWSVYGVYDNRQVKVNGIIKSTAKTGWHNAPAKVANDMLAQQCGITLVDFVNIEEFMNNREQVTDKAPADYATIEETDGSEEDDEETFVAVIPTEDDDYDETDEPEILDADLFVNIYHSPIQERYASVTRSINGEQLHFFHHRLAHISAPALNLEVYFDNGRMNFWHGFKRIARDKVWQVPIIKETAKVQTESFGKFFAGDHTSKFFKVSVYPTFADGSEHNYVRYFDFFNQAQKFVEEVKTFVGDVPTQIYITSGGQYLYTRINGIENYTLPAVDVTEAQSRLDELNKAIADNESFADKCDDDLTASKLRIANSRNKRSIAYYEAALRMTEPASLETRPAFEDGKVYVLHAHDIIGRPTTQLFKVKRGKMFGKNFLAIFEYIKRLNKFSVNAERYQIYTSDEGEYIKGIYAEDNFYHRLYAKDLTEDPTIAPPADDFMTKLNDLSAAVAIAKAEEQKASDAVDEAQKVLDAAKGTYNAACDKTNAAIVAYKTFGCQKAKELRATLLENDIKFFSDAKIKIINQQGEEVARPDLSQIFITFYNGVFKVSASWDNFATYDTPEEVTDVIERLKAAIARGDKDFSFAPETKPIEPVKFQVGATYAGKLPAKIAKKTITVTKISKAFVFFTMKYEKHLLTWRLKLRTDGKTEFVKDECGIFVRASDLVKELIA